MKIENSELLEEFRKPGPCEVCRKPCLVREAHHIWHRTPTLDVRINLVALGSTLGFECPCHSFIHAAREGRITVTSVEEIPEEEKAKEEHGEGEEE